MKRIITLIAIAFIGISVFAQGNLKQSAQVGFSTVCNYDIYFVLDTLLGGPSRTLMYLNQTGSIPTTPVIFGPFLSEYIVEFGVRPNTGGAWTVQALGPTNTSAANISLNSFCGAGLPPFRQVGYDQTGTSFLNIAAHDQ